MRTAFLLLLLLSVSARPVVAQSPESALLVGAGGVAGLIGGAMGGAGLACVPGCQGFVPGEAVAGGAVGSVFGALGGAAAAHRLGGGTGSVGGATLGTLFGTGAALAGAAAFGLDGWGAIGLAVGSGVAVGALGYVGGLGKPLRGRQRLHLHPATGPDGGSGLSARLVL